MGAEELWVASTVEARGVVVRGEACYEAEEWEENH